MHVIRRSHVHAPISPSTMNLSRKFARVATVAFVASISAFVAPTQAQMSVDALPPPVAVTQSANIAVIDDIQFGMGDDKPLYLNITEPRVRTTALIPALIWIHGGGWHAGNRYSGEFECATMAAKGYFCVSIDYRLSQDYVWPAQIEDCKCAVRYLRANAHKYGIDPNAIGAWGDSSGGHLAAMLGTSVGAADLEGDGGYAETSSAVQAVCDFYGPTDISQMQAEGSDLEPSDPLSAPALLFGTGGLAAHADAVRQANPCAYVGKSSASFLIIHGAEDTTVPLAQSVLLADSLQAAHIPVTLDVIAGGGHGGAAYRSAAVVAAYVGFFDRALKSVARRDDLSMADGGNKNSRPRLAASGRQKKSI
jgi:acetyl esterase/lipase